MNVGKRRVIGASEVGLPLLGVGCGSLANAAGEDSFDAMIDYAWQRGIRYFDTAALYLGGESERRLGTALGERAADRAIISTKVGRYQNHTGSSIDPASKRSFFDYSRDTTFRSVEQSLARLKLDRLDLVMIHDVDHDLCGDDYQRRFDEAMEGAYQALVSLRASGVVKAIGVAAMDWVACFEFAKAGDFNAVMPAGEYTLLHQDCTPLLNHCLDTGLAWIAASPFNSGILATGAIANAFYDMKPATPEVLDRVARLEAICARHGVPLAAAALQFPTRHPAVSSVVVGNKSPRELEVNLELLNHPIPDALWDELNMERNHQVKHGATA